VSHLLADTAREVDRHLERAYGRKTRRRAGDPLDGLIRTILSQNTSDVNSHRAFRALKQRFPTWQQARQASTAAVAEAIGSGGLANVKAVRIRAILDQIHQDRGELTLHFLRDLEPAEALEYLLGFSGVGPKTAACVLTFYCGCSVFPVDTHVFRIARRLGWLDGRATPETAHEALQGVVPPEIAYQLHLNMVQHGRRLCRPHRPRCQECPLADLCVQRPDRVSAAPRRSGF
jgi:endonuclease-3